MNLNLKKKKQTVTTSYEYVFLSEYDDKKIEAVYFKFLE